MPVTKETIAVTLDIELVNELRRIRTATDAPISRQINRLLRGHLTGTTQ
jgi:hypothetical protein